VVEPGTHNFTIYQGATFELDLQYKDSTGTGVDMAGYSVAAKLADLTDNSTILATFTTSFTDASVGKFQIKLTANQTSALTKGGLYDILITEPGGDKYYILQGRVFLDPGITGA
tara:strand:+ start:645 stop:986 length:342 start_codon:yes stop_codon:yes gene_type:complete